MSSGSTSIGSGERLALLIRRKKFEISLTIGALAFITVLMGVTDWIKLLTASGAGFLSGALCFAFLSFLFKNIKPTRKRRRQKDKELSSQLNSMNTSMSIHTSANYEVTPDKRAEQQGTGPLKPKEWSSYLIEAIEWRVFDRLCVAYWRLKGNNIAGIAERAQDGIDFFISAPKRKDIRIGVVQTRSALSATPNVDDIRALIHLRNKNNLSVAILMYAGRLSQVTQSYCARNDVRLINSINLSKGLQALSKREQQSLMKTLIRPDYMIPSCPACLIKLVKRQKRQTGKLFWGCVSYPICRFTLDHT